MCDEELPNDVLMLEEFERTGYMHKEEGNYLKDTIN